MRVEMQFDVGLTREEVQRNTIKWIPAIEQNVWEKWMSVANLDIIKLLQLLCHWIYVYVQELVK